MCVALHSLLGGEIHPLERNATLIALLLGQLVDEPMNRTVDGAPSDAIRNVAFQIQVAGRRPVEGGSAVRRSDPRTARASLARRSWASQRINPGTRRAPSSIVSSARTWRPSWRCTQLPAMPFHASAHGKEDGRGSPHTRSVRRGGRRNRPVSEPRSLAKRLSRVLNEIEDSADSPNCAFSERACRRAREPDHRFTARPVFLA